MSLIKLFDFERWDNETDSQSSEINNEEIINKKYADGVSRVITETGSYKVSILKDLFSPKNYKECMDVEREDRTEVCCNKII